MAEFQPRPTGGETAAGTPGGLLAAQALRDGGVDAVFTVCGGHILGFLDGCLELGIRVVDARHEGAAALAAEGWALATGRPGFAAVTAGPGFGNALTALIDAGIWTLPMVLLAGRTGIHQSHRGAVMDVDQRAIAAPVSKWAATCYHTDRIPHFVAEALYRATAGRPGAVYIEIPQDVFMARATPLPGSVPTGFPAVPPTPAGAPEDVERALDLLQRAERPLVLAGGGAFWSGAGEEIARFCERAQVPVTTTSAARGVVPDSHPWCLGSLVHAGIAMPAADVVLVLGSAFNANTMYGQPPLYGFEQKVIQVDIRPESMGGNHLPDVAIAGDVRRVVADLADGWRKSVEGRETWRDQARSLAVAAREQWDAQIAAHRGARVHAGAMAREVAAFAKETTGGAHTLVADGGDALAWALAYMEAEAPGRLLSTTTALGTLGVGMPFSIAAAAARPGEPVFLVVGDGSFGLSAMEIDTAVRHRLPIVAVVSNNIGWRDVTHEQDAWFGPGRHVASELADTRYDQLAQALGGHGERVRSIEELRPALSRALDSGLPSVVDVETDPDVLSELLRNLGALGLM